MKLKQFLRHPTANKPVKAALIIVLASAIMHVILVIVMAIVHKQPSLMSPIDVLGISAIFPEAKDSILLNILSWTLLLIAFFIVLRIIVAKSHKHPPTTDR